MSRVKLGDVAREHKETVKGDKSNYPIVGLEHLISENIRLTQWDLNKENTFTKIFRKGCVLFGRRRAYLKKAVYADFDGICSGDITVIEAIPGKILPELLPFVIQNDDLFDYAVGKSAGSLSPRVKWEHLKNYEFELPDIEKQHELAKILWSIVETKESYERLMAATDKLVKSQFIELLSDSRAEKVLIKDAFTLQMGKTPARNDSKCWDSKDHKWMTISDLEDGATYTEDTKEYISDYAVKTSGIKITPKNSVIMSFKLTIGRALITAEDIFTNEAIMTFLPKRKIDVKFLRYFLSNKDWSEKSNQAVKGITLNKESIGNSTITIPPEEVMKRITMLINQSDKSKFELENCIKNAVSMYKKILKEYLG